MTKTVNKTDLGYLGFEAQMQIVKGMIEDAYFFKSVESVVDANAFAGEQSQKLREVVCIIKDFFKNNNRIPSYREIDVLMANKASTEIDMEENKAIIEELKSDKYLQGMDVPKGIAKNFFKQQATVKAAKKLLDSITKKGFEDNKTIPNVVKDLTEIDKDAEVKKGYSVMELFDDIMSRTEEEKVPCGIPELDEAMRGGISKGMLGLLIAGTGAGKTTFTTIMANGAAICGYKVLQIFFEENAVDMGAKHYAAMSGIFTSDLNSKADKQEAWNTIKKIPNVENAMRNNIRLLRMNNGETQVSDIKNAINHFINAEGFKPDVVFIDYFSCLQKSSNKMVEYDNECKAGEKSMKKLEQMAQDLNIAIWVAEQTNRNGVKPLTANDRIANVQGSFRITQPASFILYLDRMNTSSYTRANLYMDKSRGCEPAKWENFFLNNGNLQIDLSDTEMDQKDVDLIYKDDNYPFTSSI